MLLVIDTSCTRGQLALTDYSGVEVIRSWQKDGSHSEKLTVELTSLLGEASCQFNQISQIAVVIGPGSFTGLRVGINCAKTLAYSLAVPLLPVNTLTALAISNDLGAKNVISLLDAQRNSVFLSQFLRGSQWQSRAENIIVNIDDLPDFFAEPAIVCGSGWTRYEQLLAPGVRDNAQFTNEWLVMPDVLEWIAKQSAQINRQWQDVQPLYLRKSAAEEKRS